LAQIGGFLDFGGYRKVSPQKAVLREEDGLFFIPIKFWPLVLIGAGIAFYFVSG